MGASGRSANQGREAVEVDGGRGGDPDGVREGDIAEAARTSGSVAGVASAARRETPVRVVLRRVRPATASSKHALAEAATSPEPPAKSSDPVTYGEMDSSRTDADWQSGPRTRGPHGGAARSRTAAGRWTQDASCQYIKRRGTGGAPLRASRAPAPCRRCSRGKCPASPNRRPRSNPGGRPCRGSRRTGHAIRPTDRSAPGSVGGLHVRTRHDAAPGDRRGARGEGRQGRRPRLGKPTAAAGQGRHGGS